MPLTREEHDLLVDTINLFNENPKKLNEWETNFMSDFQRKFDEHGEDCFMSPKQRAALSKIYQKLANLSGPVIGAND